MPFAKDVQFENQTGKCVIFSAPSGAGKTTIVRHLLDQAFDLEFSVSACSRGKRPGETHGKDYYYYSVEEFKELIENDEFLEWEEVYTDHFYGTLKAEIERIWAGGHHVIFDVDVVGGLNLKKIFGDRALAVFVNPPSVEELEKRLRSRSTETEDRINTRISKAKEEIGYAEQFDIILNNFVLDDAFVEADKLVSRFLSKAVAH